MNTYNVQQIVNKKINELLDALGMVLILKAQNNNTKQIEKHKCFTGLFCMCPPGTIIFAENNNETTNEK